VRLGDKILPTIDESILIHDKLLLIFSEHPFESDWVGHLAENVCISNESASKAFCSRHAWMMLSWIARLVGPRSLAANGISGTLPNGRIIDDYKTSFERLLRALKPYKSCSPLLQPFDSVYIDK
jgi:hypothetical protein